MEILGSFLLIVLTIRGTYAGHPQIELCSTTGYAQWYSNISTMECSSHVGANNNDLIQVIKTKNFKPEILYVSCSNFQQQQQQHIIKADLNDDLSRLKDASPVVDDTVNIILEEVQKIYKQTKANHRRINKILK